MKNFHSPSLSVIKADKRSRQEERRGKTVELETIIIDKGGLMEGVVGNNFRSLPQVAQTSFLNHQEESFPGRE